MGGFIGKIRSVFLNRNTVTILAVIAGVIVLWMVYSYTLSSAIDPIKVPVATTDLIAGHKITTEDFEMVEINSAVVKNASVITRTSLLVGYYVDNGTSIKQGAMFYTDQVVSASELTSRDLEIIPENYREYWLNVDNTTTYANSIYPGDKIDLWLKARIDGAYVYEEFIVNIEVINVKDADGNNVFDVSSGREPEWLSFAVPDEMYEYLKKIEYLSGTELFPVPKNSLQADSDAETDYANEQLKAYIDSLSVPNNYTSSSTTDTEEDTATE